MRSLQQLAAFYSIYLFYFILILYSLRIFGEMTFSQVSSIACNYINIELHHHQGGYAHTTSLYYYYLLFNQNSKIQRYTLPLTQLMRPPTWWMYSSTVFGMSKFTTILTPGRSMPRPRTAVHTRTGYSPSLKHCSVSVLSLWGLSPCREAARMSHVWNKENQTLLLILSSEEWCKVLCPSTRNTNYFLSQLTELTWAQFYTAA